MGMVAETFRLPDVELRTLAELRRKSHNAAARLLVLSSRERDVLRELAIGASNKLVGRRLSISPRTVEIYRANMMRKLRATHLADALRLVFMATLFDG